MVMHSSLLCWVDVPEFMYLVSLSWLHFFENLQWSSHQIMLHVYLHPLVTSVIGKGSSSVWDVVQLSTAQKLTRENIGENTNLNVESLNGRGFRVLVATLLLKLTLNQVLEFDFKSCILFNLILFHACRLLSSFMKLPCSPGHWRKMDPWFVLDVVSD